MIKTPKDNLILRAPVVVVLGHIDHGKTTLLDFIRKSRVAEKETGGITQHVGAYEIEQKGKKITFIDTPGHEAFSQIRSRGAHTADIAVLVVDATESVKTQTKEAISHIKKAEIPIIVAINKMDKSEANPEKVKRELIREDITVESMGGKVPSVEVSAKTGKGVPDLLELILLIAEMENLKTNTSKSAEGVIIEAFQDSKRGAIATLLINEGRLKVGQIVGTESALGKVKGLADFRGKAIKEALPSQPVIMMGFGKVPWVGESFRVFETFEEAENNLKKEKELGPETIDLQDDQKIFNLILKTDVLGSLEALEEILRALPQERIVLRILKSEVGEVNESDIKSASQAKAKILAFRVKTNAVAQNLAERERVRIMNFEIIYELVEGVRKYMEKLVEPEIVRKDLGKLKVLVVFLTEKNRQIVGGKIVEGEVKKGQVFIEVLRNNEIKGTGRMINLQKNKKDVDRATKGDECGILYEGDIKIEQGDIVVFYNKERIKPEI